MRLDDYLSKLSLTNDEFAKRVGASTTAVQYWRHGQRVPRRAQMLAIIEATGGTVTPNDFLLYFRSDQGAPSAQRLQATHEAQSSEDMNGEAA